MCELFGISSIDSVSLNDPLREFFSHSVRHPNGWGMAIFHGNFVNLEKEPVPAHKSVYLRERLRHKIEARNMLAHIRLATRGAVDYENCHPFVMKDNRGRTWTLAHNGTIFDCPALDGYVRTQEGRTDSERILCHIITLVNERQTGTGRALTAEERFHVADEAVCRISPHNKVNLLIYDSEQFYVHTNYSDSLYLWQTEGTAIFSTVPLDTNRWRPVPLTTLHAYKDGREIFRGTNHGYEYHENPNDMRLLFMDYAEL